MSRHPELNRRIKVGPFSRARPDVRLPVMGYIQVNPADLLYSAGELEAIVQDLRSPPQRIQGLRRSQIGAGTIDRALDDFAGGWQFGMSRMVEGVEFTAKGLRTAGEHYTEVEHKVSLAFGGA